MRAEGFFLFLFIHYPILSAWNSDTRYLLNFLKDPYNVTHNSKKLKTRMKQYTFIVMMKTI